MMTMGAMHVGDGADEESEVGGILSQKSPSQALAKYPARKRHAI